MDSIIKELGYTKGIERSFEGETLREIGLEPSKDPVTCEFIVTNVDKERKSITLNSVSKEKI